MKAGLESVHVHFLCFVTGTEWHGWHVDLCPKQSTAVPDDVTHFACQHSFTRRSPVFDMILQLLTEHISSIDLLSAWMIPYNAYMHTICSHFFRENHVPPGLVATYPMPEVAYLRSVRHTQGDVVLRRCTPWFKNLKPAKSSESKKKVSPK